VRARVDHDEVRRLWVEGLNYKDIAKRVSCTPVYVRLILKERVLLVHERKARGLKSRSRMVQGSLHGKSARGMPPIDHPAIAEKRTLYPKTVRPPDDGHGSILKPGDYSGKIGGLIMKGKWKGCSVYTLTLEERATCPVSCKHWRSCFGNSMHQADRIQHGPELEARLRREVAYLCQKHPVGVAIRLHVLGDFYSVTYVDMWRDLLTKHPNLVCFGFTARWDRHNDLIAAALRSLVLLQWERFAIRFSNAPFDLRSTVSIEHPLQCPADATICPEQLGQTESCSTCALCWHSRERIAFIQH
jgi:hypothetical protein